jgi:hypothetical protein
MNRYMMHEFSRRTTEDLAKSKLFRHVLPAFHSFLDLNVKKEVDKDRLAIFAAAASQSAGESPGDVDIGALLESARAIDEVFFRQATLFPISINLRYEDLEPIRRSRIELLVVTAYRVLAQWEETPRFRGAVVTVYSEEQFRALLREILILYGMETRLLSNSVRVPFVVARARNTLAGIIHAAMEDAAEQLAGELARDVYRRIS